MSVADPVAAPSSTNTWINGLKWGQRWDSPGDGTTIIYYAVAQSGDLLNYFGDVIAPFTPYAEEVAAISNILQSIEHIINVTFVATSDVDLADIVFASVSDAAIGGYLGTSSPPGEDKNPNTNDWQSLVLVNREAYSMNGGVPDGLSPGGYDYITWLHELGHDLGLAHPHDDGGTSTIFPGVTSAFNDYGNYNMNQGIFTTMSYNDGWVAGTGARGKSGVAQYGWQSTMMALDVATLQLLYGANTSFANGDNTYTLGDENVAGQGYQSIWDTGGSDALVYNGSRNVTLDLRAATLANAVGGGGFVSYVTSGSIIYSGFTIANAVVIENATGGGGNDSLIGNLADNILNGGTGGDSMTGGKGNDTYYVDNILDKIVELANEGLDIVYAAINWILGSNVENLYLEDTALAATGNSSANALYGTDGANILDGKAGTDLLHGFGGDDTYIVDASGDQIFEDADQGTDTATSSVSYALGDNVEKLTLTGSSAINGTGNATANVITGNSGNNILAGLGGADFLNGGAGTDTASYATSAEAVTVGLMTGTASGGDAAGDTFSGIENLTGSNWDDTLEGNGGANVLAGGLGIDTVSYEHASAAVKVSLATTSAQNTAGAGSDTLSGFENLTGSGFNDTLTGNAGSNVLWGLAGNDILNGGAGADTLVGGDGNDTYVGDNIGDVVDEGTGSGTDLVQAAASFDLSATLGEVENLTLTGSAAVNGIGNGLINSIIGNGGANIIEGKGGADALDGGSGTDTVSYASSASGVTVVLNGSTATFGTGGDADGDSIKNFENVTGSALTDILTGNGSANVIDGGAGADAMNGGAGNDTYVVDDAGDTIAELTTGGTDLVKSSIVYSLVGTNLENLTLTGINDIDATGNALANILTGNAGNNRLDGGVGADTMIGGLGDDTYVVGVSGDKVTELAGQGNDTIETALATFSLSALTAVENLTYTGIANFTGTGNALANTISSGVLNDILNGGTGADTLIGWDGNDTYVVDNIGDVVDESTGSGTDLVQSSVSFNLSTTSGDVEKLTLTGSGAINGTGNGFANTIIGNGGANVIEGKDGADILDGGSGTDTVSYASSASGVTVVLNGGTATSGVGGDAEGDSIKNFENVTGSALADFLTGNGSANSINGGAGADTMTGGGGSDSFVFSSLLDPGNIDTITDYSAPSDTMRLDDAIFSALAAGTLSSAAFRVGSAAADASDRIIYDSATGAVYYDDDGTGAHAAQQFATLSIGLSLTNSDFFVF